MVSRWAKLFDQVACSHVPASLIKVMRFFSCCSTQYAVKITPLYPHHNLIATRLLREPTILAQLPPHPNLVKVYESIRTPGHFYLVGKLAYSKETSVYLLFHFSSVMGWRSRANWLLPFVRLLVLSFIQRNTSMDTQTSKISFHHNPNQN